MALAFFDMDGTLIDADSNEVFFNFLSDEGIVDESFIKPLDDFQRRYFEGTLKIEDFIFYALKPMLGLSAQRRTAIVRKCVAERLAPVIKPGAFEAIKFHKKRGDTLIVVSATVDYIVREIAAAAGIDEIIAAPIRRDCSGRLIPELSAPVPYQQNKVVRIQSYLKARPTLTLKDSYAYGDSINDKEMLMLCEHRIAVDAAPELLDAAIPDLKEVSWK